MRSSLISFAPADARSRACGRPRGRARPTASARAARPAAPATSRAPARGCRRCRRWWRSPPGRSARSRRPPSRLLCSPRSLGADGSSIFAAHSGHSAASHGQLVDPVAKAKLNQPARRRVAYPALERRHHAGARAPRDVEAGHRVAVPVGVVPAALGPARIRDPAHALLVEPRALLAGAEARRTPRPSFRGHSSSGDRRRPCPSSPGAPARRSPSCASGAARGCPRTSARRATRSLPSQAGLRLLVEHDHLLAGVGQLRGGHESQPAPRPPRSRLRPELTRPNAMGRGRSYARSR